MRALLGSLLAVAALFAGAPAFAQAQQRSDFPPAIEAEIRGAKESMMSDQAEALRHAAAIDGLALGLPPECRYFAGTTDGCASFLATGASNIGDGVTALGSTLVVKLACAQPINAANYGIYSHRVLDFWLAGGASNSGGAVIRTFFDGDQLKAMTPKLRPDAPTGLAYYPLPGRGERFPINDPAYPPRLKPRPADDLTFFQAILEGITAIEKSGYDRLAELGGPRVLSIRTVGGGAANPAWAKMRENALGVPFLASRSAEASVGAASLVLAGKARWP